MKKFKSFALAAIGLLCSGSLSAHGFEVDGIYYNVLSEEEKTVEVTFKGSSYSDYDNEYIGSVVIPQKVIYGENTYSVTSIGRSAFYFCESLASVDIPNSVISIGAYAFSDCISLSSVTIPTGVKIIESSTFCNCQNLISVEIPNKVTSIGDCAFMGCTSLPSIEIPNGVSNIGTQAFKSCSSLTSVEIGDKVISIGSAAFEGTAWYENQPNGVVYLDNYLLGYKGTMPSKTSIEIKEGTLLIAVNAFRYCSGLLSVLIPNSVTSIGDYAFMGCTGLTSVEIGNSVTSIGNSAFYQCSGLTSVEIPNSVTSIGEYAFDGCDNLNSITSLNRIPPMTSYGPFSNYDATLYVPYGTKSIYSEAESWKNFVKIQELEPIYYELTDGEVYDHTYDLYVNNLTYTRTLPNLYWNALYVPFELPYEVIADRYEVAYINDVNGYDTDDNGEIDDLAMEIVKIKGGTLKANYPYLIKAKTEADKAMSITVEDVTLYAAEENSVRCSSVYQNYVVTGIYTQKTADELAGKLAISTSGAWQPLAAGTALNPFRLYLSIENLDDSPLKVETAAMSRMRIIECGETTGIETIAPAQQREDVIFDLSGRRVKQPAKGGVYIINGKKSIF